MKNLVFYCKDFYPMHNGYANAYRNLISTLASSQKYLIHVITTTKLNDCEELDIPNVMVHRIDGLSKVRFVRYVLNAKIIGSKINKLASKYNADLIFIESGDEPLIIPFVSKCFLKKVVVRYHSTSDTEYTVYFPGLNNKLNKIAQKYIVSNKLINYASTNKFHIDFIKDHYLNGDEYRISNKNFFVIPNTLGPDFKIPETSVLTSKEKTIFILGRMNQEGFLQKGFKDILFAINSLNLEDLNGYKIYIVGDGVLYEKVVNTLANNNLDQIVSIERSLPHKSVIENLKKARCVVMASRFEGHSMFALEALANGCVCIFSNAGALESMSPIQKFIFQKQDSFELKSKIKSITNSDEIELNNASIKSLDWYNQHYSHDFVLQQFEHLVNCINVDI